MEKKYLAYIALLAGWICFCYWLYAKELSPRLRAIRETSWPVQEVNLKLPLAFRWGSEIPLAGDGFEAWKESLKKIDTLKNLMIVSGYYFRDETISLEKGKELANRRVDWLVEYLALSKGKIMKEIAAREINADVRSNPFEAVEIDTVAIRDVLLITNDTLEICFPIKDSLRLTPFLTQQLNEWIALQSTRKDSIAMIVGTADGSGIAESADMAMERALVMKNALMQNGWQEDQINLSTGQRNLPHPIRNRCVIVYFE